MAEKWHVSKAISLSHIATTGVLILSAIVYITGIEKDVAVLQSQQSTVQSQINSMQDDNKEMFQRIDDKLDKMIDIIHSYQTDYSGRE
jgi:predicted PurR-regulated permease PerM